MNVEQIITDVLIIGGGGAGLRSAIAARETGVQVVLASKGTIGRVNNTVISRGGMAAATGYFDPQDNPQVHAADIIRAGRQISDPSLALRMAESAPSEIHVLEQLGVRFKRTTDGNYMTTHRPGHTYLRYYMTEHSKGKDFIHPLLSAARQAGVLFLPNTLFTSLLMTEAGCTAALGIKSNGEPVLLQAKAVILAAGGAGQVYACTNNPSHMTGDGYALAYMAGLPLINMEMVQFYPTNLSFSTTGQLKMISYENLVFLQGAIIRNALGEDVLTKYHINRDKMTRDVVSRAMAQEIMEGYGDNGFLQLDISGFTQEKLQSSRALLPWLAEIFPVAPAVHFILGGVPIDLNAATSLPGLWAAGEVTGGVHGANRLAGNSLAEVWSFGQLAGNGAGKLAMATRHLPKINHYFLESAKDSLQLAQGTQNTLHMSKLYTELRTLVWQSLGPVRDAQRMSFALERMQTIKKEITSGRVASARDLHRLFELRHMVLVAEASLKSALLRQESRGCHFRTDFPEEESKWRGITEIKLHQGKMQVDFKPMH